MDKCEATLTLFLNMSKIVHGSSSTKFVFSSNQIAYIFFPIDSGSHFIPSEYCNDNPRVCFPDSTVSLLSFILQLTARALFLISLKYHYFMQCPSFFPYLFSIISKQIKPRKLKRYCQPQTMEGYLQPWSYSQYIRPTRWKPRKTLPLGSQLCVPLPSFLL